MNRDIYRSGEYLKKNPTWHGEDSSWKAKHILKIINDNNLRINSICEVGCGSGQILKELYKVMAENVYFIGYEISPYAFKLCQQWENERVQFFLKDLLEEKEVFFDLILAIDVFEHIEDYLGFLKKLHSKGRYKIFHIPLDLSVQSVIRSSPIIKCRYDVGHLHYFTKELALATLADTGYKIIDYFYTASSIELPPKSLISSIARLPRKLMFMINKDFSARILGGFSLMVLTK